MLIEFCPENPSDRGLRSKIIWENRELQEAIARVFNTSPREEIIRLDITKHGITAHFETRNDGLYC